MRMPAEIYILNRDIIVSFLLTSPYMLGTQTHDSRDGEREIRCHEIKERMISSYRAYQDLYAVRVGSTLR